MDIINTLNKKLLEQPFEIEPDQAMSLNKYRQIAFIYSVMENALAVLSDLKSKKSYVYNGGFASALGLAEKGTIGEIASIWEENILCRIHPDDLLEKYILELQFFQLVKDLPVSERLNYYVTSTMRMRDKSEKYVAVQHRIFYASSPDSMWLTLCLYNFSYGKALPGTYEGMIVNSATGSCIRPDRERYNDLLSAREKEVLQLIAKGKMSKDIADLLSISKHTVDRHRQNILEKLRVKNSIEACRLALFGMF